MEETVDSNKSNSAVEGLWIHRSIELEIVEARDLLGRPFSLIEQYNNTLSHLTNILT